MFGLLNVDKPEGVTSREVVNRVVSCVKPTKVGHAGTLDPMATGVLILCLGRATRLVQHLQRLPKTYRAEFLLGQTSDTDDRTGHVTASPNVTPCRRADVESALQTFVGDIQQVPPQFSAVHVDGQRAYALARRGQEVSLTPRPVSIYGIEVLEFAFPQLSVEIECGSGTYIRALARDLGQQLGCGGLMSALTRTAVGPFSVGHAIAYEQLQTETIRAALQNVLKGLPYLPRRVCSSRERERLRRGQPIRAVDVTSAAAVDSEEPEEPVALVSSQGDLLALAEFKSDRQLLQPRQVFVQD